MDTESNVDVVLSQVCYKLGKWVLGLSDSETVTWYNDNIFRASKKLTNFLDGCLSMSTLNLGLFASKLSVTTENDVLK